MNAITEGFDDQAGLYAANALALGRSLALQGIRFTLLTNRRDLLADLQNSISVEEIPFRTKMPPGTPFYSAHYKIDAFDYLAGLPGDGYKLFCDLDVICVKPLPLALKNLIARGIPFCYDVTDQVLPAHGQEAIIRDISIVGAIQSEGRWYGGECIGGPPNFFQLLHAEIQQLLPNYIANIPASHHVSDEAVLSPALELMRTKGGYVADGGTLGLISRYWNTRVLHPQKEFAWCRQCFLLHLPADKRLLAEASAWPDGWLREFVSHYERRLRRARSWRGKVDRMISKVRKASQSWRR